jgi:hypothetical protein
MRIGTTIAHSLQSERDASTFVAVQHDDLIRISAPSVVRLNVADRKATFNIRVQRPVNGYVVVRDGDKELYRRRYRCMPERRILLKDVDMSGVTERSVLRISIESR